TLSRPDSTHRCPLRSCRVNRTILLSRTETAIKRIAAETERLGGTLSLPSVRGNAEYRQLALLEAVAGALSEIRLTEPVEPVVTEVVTVAGAGDTAETAASKSPAPKPKPAGSKSGKSKPGL